MVIIDSKTTTRMPQATAYKMLAKEDIAVGGAFRKDFGEGAAFVEVIADYAYPGVATFTPDAELRWLKDGKVQGSIKLSQLKKLTNLSDYAPPRGVIMCDEFGTEIETAGSGTSTLRMLVDLTLLGNGQGGLGEGWGLEIKDTTDVNSGSVTPTYTINVGVPALPGQAVIYTGESLTITSDSWKVITNELATELWFFTEQTVPVDAQVASGTGNVLISVNEKNQGSPIGGWATMMVGMDTYYILAWSTRYAFRPLLAQGLQVRMNQALATAAGASVVLGLVVS